MNTAPSDSHARALALDTRTSFAVSAPAGSGKTGLLTQRVLALLAKCDNPENVLAITFTKKAATEMQERILNALQDAAQTHQAPEDPFKQTTWLLAKEVLEQNQKHQWQLLQCPNRLRITTIDGFCRQLSQQSPLNHRLGDAPEILDRPEIAYLQAARQTLALLESDEPIKQDLIRLIKHFNNQLTTIENLLVRLLSKRDQWLGALFSAKDKREYLEAVLKDIICEQFAEVRRQLQTQDSDIALLADYAAKNLDKDPKSASPIKHCLGLTALPNASTSEQKQWQGVCELLLTNDGSLRKRVDKRQGFPASDKTQSKEEQIYAKSQKEKFTTLLNELADNETGVEALAAIKSLPSPKYSDSQWELLDSLTRLLHRLVAELYLTFQANGKTDYIEITLAALDALGEIEEPTDLSLLLEYRLQHILIDEFQDTSSTQLMLLERLTAGWQNNDAHTLFIVGDAMQSCYRFRNANVGLFLGIREHGLGDIHLQNLDLEVNFRSHKNIVNWVNRIFTPVFPQQNSINNGAVRYSNAVAFLSEGTTELKSEIRYVLLLDDKQRKAEAEYIVRQIKQCREENSTQTIAVLVRNRKQVEPISRALNMHKLHYRATDIDSLAKQMVIQDLLSLTRALLYPHDRIAWLALLRTPWCGLDMHDLYTVANTSIDEAKPSDIFANIKNARSLQLSRAGQALLENFSDIINAALLKQQRCTLRIWIESTWRALGGHALLPDEKDADNAERFFEYIDQHDEAGRIVNWQAFLSAIESLYSKPDTNADSEQPAIEIMTIHKSKGLEFDTVIIPGIDKGQRSDSTELLEWMERINPAGGRDLVISPIHATGSDTDTIYHHIRQQSSQKQALEADRVFYVGCTRAINNLYLVGCAERIDKPEDEADIATIESIKAPSSGSTLATLWPHIKNDIEILAPAQKIEESAGESKHPNVILRRPLNWQPQAVEPVNLLADYRPNTHHDTGADGKNRASDALLVQRHARYFGTVLHEALQQIILQDYRTFSDQKLKHYSQLWLNKLTRLGTPKALAGEQVKRIQNALHKMLNNPERHWLLDHTHFASHCELSLHYFAAGEFKHSIVDRTFICEEQGTQTRWIIDYKSSEPSEAQSYDGFIEDELRQYQPQMAHYASLFKGEAYPVKVALYFPLIDHFVEL